MRTFIIWLVIFVSGLLIGFIPQYLKASSARQQLEICNSTMQLTQIKQLAAQTYVAATQLNYGVASGYAQQFFDQAQHLAASSTDSNVHSLMTEVLSSRDKITADLAKGDSSVVGDLQPIVMKVETAQP
jgi:uncharacterized membrane-anchored protein YhcB (DUF1043 family)